MPWHRLGTHRKEGLWGFWHKPSRKACPKHMLFVNHIHKAGQMSEVICFEEQLFSAGKAMWNVHMQCLPGREFSGRCLANVRCSDNEERVLTLPLQYVRDINCEHTTCQVHGQEANVLPAKQSKINPSVSMQAVLLILTASRLTSALD